MATWCPIYPGMFYGSYTIYWTAKQHSPTVCGPEQGCLSGPNSLVCGCNAGSCFSDGGPPLDAERCDETEQAKPKSGDCGCSQQHSIVAGESKLKEPHGHNFHKKIKSKGASLKSTSQAFAPGVDHVGPDEVTKVTTPISVVFKYSPTVYYEAIVFLLKFTPNDFDMPNPPDVEDPDIAVVGTVVDKASTKTPNATMDPSSDGYALIVNFTDVLGNDRQALIVDYHL